MGLDMYLKAERFLSKYIEPVEDSKSKIEKINDLFGITNGDDDFRAETVIFNIAYWRKANAIHAWFVRNVQDGKDECQKSYVTRDQLKELLTTCKLVLEDHKKSKDVLPTQSGFFFGSTDYDEGYFDDLQSTVTQLERILNHPALETMDFYYQSSW